MSRSFEGLMAACLIVTGITAAALSAAACDQASPGAAGEQSSMTTAPQPAAPPAGAGMKIYRDPDTGEITTPPPDAAVQSAPRGVPPASGMVERPGTTPAGGVLLDGVPKTSMRATRDAAGSTATRCGRVPAAGAE